MDSSFSFSSLFASFVRPTCPVSPFPYTKLHLHITLFVSSGSVSMQTWRPAAASGSECPQNAPPTRNGTQPPSGLSRHRAWRMTRALGRKDAPTLAHRVLTGGSSGCTKGFPWEMIGQQSSGTLSPTSVLAYMLFIYFIEMTSFEKAWIWEGKDGEKTISGLTIC